MSTSTTNLTFGLSVNPSADHLDHIRELVRAAEDGGLDLISIQDHPSVPSFLDTFSLIALLLTETRTVRFFPNVANLQLRPPAMMAKAAATLDRIGGGRFELGLGAGAPPEGSYAMGGARWSPAESIDLVAEAIAVMRAFWRGGSGIEYTGRHYQLRGVDAGPRPAHPIGIWIGALRPRMLRLTGRLADGWSASLPSYVPYEQWGASQDLVDEGARQAGRDAAEVLRICNLSGTITDQPGDGGPLRGRAPLRGNSDDWIEKLSYLATELRFDAFIYWPERPSREQVERFAHEVVPAVRVIRPARASAG